MADVITRFKLETSQFDSKLRDESKALADISRHAQLAGKEFNTVTQKNVEAARAFGNMATSATNAKDKVKELVGSFNTMAKAYNDLTQDQQQSDFGKAMAESLNTLKGRISEAKQELASMGDSTKSTGGIMGTLKDKLTVNIDALKLFNIGLQGAKVAIDVAKDAFFASEATVDEWGRVMDSSKSLYEGFLTALNTGDISGYLGRIDEIVTAARRAYDELDRLGTMKTIQAPKMSAQQTENERMRMMIQTGRYIAPVDGRRASMKDGQLLTPEQIRRIEAQLQNGMKAVVTLVGNEVKQTGKTIDAVYDRQAKELGLSLSEFRKGTSSMAEFDKRMKGYDDYQKWREQHTTIDLQSGRETVARGNPHEQFAKWGTFRVDGQRYNDLVRLIQQRDQQAGQVYSMQSQAYRTMNRAEGVTLRQLMGGGSGGGSGRSGGGGGKGGGTNELFDPTSIAAQEKLVQELTKLWRTCGETVRDEYKARLDEAKAVLQEMQNPTKQLEMAEVSDLSGRNPKANFTHGAEFNPMERIGNIREMINNDLSDELERLKELLANAFDPESIKAYSVAIASVTEKMGELKGDKKHGTKADKGEQGKLLSEFNEKAEKFVGGLASISNGFKGLGIDFPKEVDSLINILSSVMQIIQGVQAVISIFQVGAITANTTALTVNTAALIGRSFLGFQNGGVVHAASGYAVPGNSFSGDNIPIMANAGEVVLTRAMAGNLASQLQGTGFGNMELVATVRAEQIDFVMNNRGRRTGRGEYVQSNKRR